MADMLVRLYDLPEVTPRLDKLAAEGLVIRRAEPWEQEVLRRFCVANFSEEWAQEGSVAFARVPISLFLAQDQESRQLVGFCAYECTRPDFVGPMGVAEAYRRRGIGAALLLVCLHAMAALGYAYAIIGAGSGHSDFYGSVCGATVIAGSEPGVYRYPVAE